MNRTNTIRAEIAEVNESLSTTRATVKAKTEEIATLRDDLRRQVKSHAGSNRFPAGIRQGQEKLGVLTSDCDLLEDLADELESKIEALQAELDGAMEAERLDHARQRADGLKATHTELVASLVDLQGYVNAKIEYEILPLIRRLQDHRGESIVQALGCATITQAWEQYPEIMEALLVALHGLSPLSFDAQPLTDAAQEAQFTLRASADWISNYMPMHLRTRPTVLPKPDMRTTWKPVNEEEAKRLGLLVNLGGKNVILTPEAKEAYDRMKLAEHAAANARQ